MVNRVDGAPRGVAPDLGQDEGLRGGSALPDHRPVAPADRFKAISAAEVRALRSSLQWDAPDGAALDALAGAGHGLRVMWWNVEFCHSNEPGGDKSLQKNLHELVRSPLRPDVVVLGEYKDGCFPPTMEAMLRRVYPSREFVGYNEHVTETGIVILSTAKIEDLTIEELTSASANTPDDEMAALPKHARRYIRARIPHAGLQGGSVDLMPVHMMQPWRSIKREWGGGIIGTLAVGLSMFLDGDNPLARQIDNHRTLMDADPRRGRSAVLIGDLNTPSRAIATPTAFQRAASGLKNAFAERSVTTWPAASAKDRYGHADMQLDHALTSGPIRAVQAKALPLRGADHYPIYLVLR